MSLAEITTWTTAELDFVLRDETGEVPEGLFDGLSEAVVSIVQGNVQGNAKLEKRGEDVGIDIENATLHVRFDQRETAKLQGGTRAKPKTADTQVNLYYEDTNRNATYETQLNVYRNLHPQRLP